MGVPAALLLFGRWSDTVGRRPLLLAGLASAPLSSVVFLLAGPVWVPLVGRRLSGVSAGIFAGAATAAVIEATPPSGVRGPRPWRPRRTRAVSGWGPLLAGIAVQYLHERQRLSVPAEVRVVFVGAATAGFAVRGLFTAIVPRIVTEVLGVGNLAVAGLVVFLLLGSSSLAQLTPRRAHRALVFGCVLLIVGFATAAAEFAALVVGAVVTSVGRA